MPHDLHYDSNKEVRPNDEPGANVNLRLGHTLRALHPALHNGPGLRISLWLQGCSLRCTAKCLNPQFLSPDRGYVFSVNDVRAAIRRVLRSSPCTVEGLTVLGGEPTDQCDALAMLLRWAQSENLSTMLYSGHTLEVLSGSTHPDMASLLDVVDLLIDGPYRDELYDEELAWRGSSNQRLVCLSSRYNPSSLEEAWHHQKKAYSIVAGWSGVISISGFQDRATAGALERRIRISAK